MSVDLIETMGDCETIVHHARMCTGQWDADVGNRAQGERLLANLIRDGHTSPFEQVRMTFRLRVPIFVMRQIARHRTASMLERSLRYTVADVDAFLPLGDDTFKLTPHGRTIADVHYVSCRAAFAAYRDMIALGAPPEVARRVLPLATMTEAIWTMDLRNLLRFLRLRQDSAAQTETRQVADMIAEHVAAAFALTWAAWTDATDAQRGRF